jgi:hydroxymethylpyrimidine/phosphomethylpyrimidine kinase
MASLPPIVLSFAASDPTGGAGLQADLLTLASMGCHPLSVVTALTVQDTRGVEALLAIDPDWVSAQARALLEDMPVAAFKLGVLGSAENAIAIADVLEDYPDVPVVVDPVIASGRGDPLADDALIDALRNQIVPQSTIVTPNSLEARRLAEDDVEDEGLDLDRCAARLLAMGCDYVLVTGPHELGAEVVNTLYGDSGIVRADRWPRLAGSYHGSGCTLASAIAAALANGLGVAEAVRDAQEYTWQALASGFRPGMGQLLPDRFFWAREVGGQDDEAAA